MEREEFPVDVLFVGGGVAGLSSSIHLMQLINEHNEKINKGEIKAEIIDEPAIAVIDKGNYMGAHSFSGAVIDPTPFYELFPELDSMEIPIESKVNSESVYILTEKKSFKLPIVPRNLKNSDSWVISLSKITKWLADKAEEMEIMLLPEFAGNEILKEGNRVIGIRTGDKGLNPDGTQKSNFEAGNDILTNMVVFAEGSRGSLTKKIIKDYKLEGKYPQVYELGVKEVFELPEGKSMSGVIHHSTGYPLTTTGGGSFFYGMGGNLVTLGVAASLDSADPLLDVHEKLQELKGHPIYKEILKDAKPVYYGAKTLSGGGYYTIPKTVADGVLLIGESASLCNPEKLKGVHLAVRSGMMAAKTVFKCMLAEDFSEKMLMEYDIAVKENIVEKELKRCRNFHAAVGKTGIKTFINIGLQEITFGRGLVDPMELHDDHSTTKKIKEFYKNGVPEKPKYNNEYLMDKLSDVFLTGTTHEEVQPSHCVIIDPKKCESCIEEYGAPCTHFCPAEVYELEKVGEKQELKVNFTNCLHCKTCDIKCPSENVDWKVPEGGGGPKYIVQ